MKYRWFNQVLTRDSGVFVVHCNNKEQAEQNVVNFIKAKNHKTPIISFNSRENGNNIILTDEIIAVFTCDADLMRDVHFHEARENERIHKDIDFSQNDDEGL